MQLLQLLGRVLGIALLARLAQRLPGRLAWWASLVVLVAVNLLPIVAVLRGSAGIGDVFLVYWLENVVVWATSIVRIATAEGAGGHSMNATLTIRGRSRSVSSMSQLGAAAFFAFHYGLFTLVHGVFTLVIVSLTGLSGGMTPVLVLAAAITASHLVSLGLVWFGRGQRKVVSPGSAMAAPYPRMIALHVAIIGGFFFLVGGPSQDGRLTTALGQNAGVAILCGFKVLIDVGFHLQSLRRARPTGPDAADDSDGLYGGPQPA